MTTGKKPSTLVRAQPSPLPLRQLLQELEENGREAPRLSAGVIRATTRNLLGGHRQGESDAAVRAHSLGTELVILATHGAHGTLGYDSFEKFAREELRVGHTTLYDRLLIARGATEEQCRLFGLDRIRHGLQIARALGKRTIGDLVPRDPARAPRLPLERPRALPPAGRGGPAEVVATTIFAQADEAQLELILRLLRTPEVKAPPSAPKAVREQASRANRARDEVSQKHPALKRLGAKAYVHAGKRRLDPGKPSTAEEIDAVMAWLQAVKKLDSRPPGGPR